MMQQVEIEDRLEELMQQEAKILRAILANLSQEQEALLSRDIQRLNFIIQERLQFLDAFERYDAKVMESAQELAELENKHVPVLASLTHDEILETLQGLVSKDNLELLSRIDQLRAIHQEIKNKHSITKYFLETDRGSAPEVAVQKKAQKIGLELLDPPASET